MAAKTVGASKVPKRTLFEVFAFTVGFFTVIAGLLFGGAGRLDVPAFWAYIAVMLAATVIGGAIVYRRSPDLVAERLHPGPGEQDRVSIPAMLVAMVAHYLIAGLDVGRAHWADSVPVALEIAGLLAVAFGIGFSLWAMIVNSFFSSAVRLQADRGQYVVTTGPYRYVRHPGYTGGLLYLLSSGVALGSWLSVLPMLAVSAVLVRRTRLEDRMLEQSLAGYSDYMRKVRYRLVPGVW